MAGAEFANWVLTKCCSHGVKSLPNQPNQRCSVFLLYQPAFKNSASQKSKYWLSKPHGNTHYAFKITIRNKTFSPLISQQLVDISLRQSSITRLIQARIGLPTILDLTS
jgi:hypothetical protein